MKDQNLSSIESAIIEVLANHGPCTSQDVNDRFPNGDLLTTMRTIHMLEKKGILARVESGSRKLFRVKTRMKSFPLHASAK